MKAAEGFEFVTRPDLKMVSELINRTWAPPCWNYDEGLLSLHIDRPSGDPELAIGQLSSDGELASFQAYMPFELEYFEDKYKSVFASFLTVSREFHGKGLAGPQQGELIERAIEKGYDLYTTMCEVGATSNRAVEKIFAKKDLPIRIVKVLQYRAARSDLVMAVLPGKASGRTRLVQDSDIFQLSALVEKLGDGCPLKKIVPNEDISFLLQTRPHCKTFVFDDGQIRAFANLLMLEVVGPDDSRTLNAYFDNVSLGDLNPEEQNIFIGDIMIGLQETGYGTAFLPETGYLPVDPFLNFRFRLLPRQLNLYIVPLRPDVLPGGARDVDSFFMDVY